MKGLSGISLAICLGLTALGAASPAFSQQSETGTLVFDLKNYTSEAKMPKRSQKDLEHAGIRWGVLDHTMVIPLVNEKFVKADTPYFTRYGEQKSLEMKPGQYTITCIGWEFASVSRDQGKNIAKDAYFNKDVVTFTVLPGKTTTLEVIPIYRAESQRRLWANLTILFPDLKVHVLEDGAPKGDDLVISRRTDKSVAWNDYQGPLKF